MNKNSAREQILKNNHKHRSWTKYFNKNVETSISGPPKSGLVRHKPKLNSFIFVETCDHINPMDNANDGNHFVDVHDKHKREDNK